jgi:hypothetical protein
MKKTKVGKKEPAVSNVLFETFIGEFVKIYTKQSVIEAAAVDDGRVEQSAPLVVQGYLLDMDSRYYYLGEHADRVSAAVAISQVVIIQEVQEKDLYGQILDDMEIGKAN